MKQALHRHPKALPYLFLTEMWERFGFYVVQGMLVLYFTQGYGFTDNESYTILGVFSALAYISPMIGGLIADRLLGFKESVIWGGVFLSIGYAFLSVANIYNFYFALATIVVGNGLFKPNISSLLGTLYPKEDTGRDAGFTFFYVGINLGALLAGLISGYVKDHFGWHAGFALASIGLILGLVIFAMGLRWGGMQKTLKQTGTSKFYFNRAWLLLFLVITIPILGFLLKSQFLGKWALPIVGIFLLFFIFYLANRQSLKAAKGLLTLNVLIISSVIFWMLWLQIFFSANLFIDRLVNKNILGFTIPTTVFYALESIYVIILGPFFAWIWIFTQRKGTDFSPFSKFIFAIAFVGLAYLILTASTYFANDAHLINPLWIVFAYFFLTVGELLLSPIGLSAVTTLSPPHLTGMMMGIWFVALGFGGQFAGLLAQFSNIPESMTDMVMQLSVYRYAFFKYASIAMWVAVGLFVVQILFRKKLSAR